MSSSVVNISARNNEAVSKVFEVKVGDPPVALNLAGSALKMMGRRRAIDPEALITISTASVTVASGGITIENAAAGRFNILIPLSRMQRLTDDEYVFDLVRTRPDGLPEVLWAGTFTVGQGVTRG